MKIISFTCHLSGQRVHFRSPAARIEVVEVHVLLAHDVQQVVLLKEDVVLEAVGFLQFAAFE